MKIAKTKPTDYLTVPEVARKLRISYPTVRKLIAAGDLDCIFIGTRILRVTRTSLEKYERRALGRGFPVIQ
jgi:excisionase family DNA binding protein